MLRSTCPNPRRQDLLERYLPNVQPGGKVSLSYPSKQDSGLTIPTSVVLAPRS